MSRFLIPAILLAISAGCGQPMNPPKYGAEFVAYVQSFQAQAQAQGFDLDTRMDNLTISFGDTTTVPSSIPGDTTIGTCSVDGNGQSIMVDQPYWERASSYGRTALLFHELGHCVLYRVHRLDVYPSGMPYSIMYPVIVGDGWMEADPQILMPELFDYGIDSMK